MTSVAAESFVTAADGTRLWTTTVGEGDRTLLLSNGGAGCCDYLEPLAALLAAPGLRIVRWEQRGVGRSGGSPDGPFTIEQCVSDLESIREAVGCTRWIVAGHSWGADLAMIYALAHPARADRILCVAGGRLNNDREWHAAYDRGVAAKLETPPAFAYPPNLVANRQINADYKRYVQRPALLRDVARLDVPALFLYGARDIRPSWPVEQVAALMPRARFVLLPGADHFPYRTHPDEIRREARAFLEAAGEA